MSAIKLGPHSRMIALRVSEEEFQRVREISGPGNVSEFVRDAVRRLIEDPGYPWGGGASQAEQVSELRERLAVIDQRIDRLTELVESPCCGDAA